jgi:hypothetical protein
MGENGQAAATSSHTYPPHMEALFVAVLAILVVSSLIVFGLIWSVEHRKQAKARPSVNAITSQPPAQPQLLTGEDLQAIYKHFVATIGWALFWFSIVGGAAALYLYN